MKGVYFDGTGFSVRDLAPPSRPEGEALVRVSAAGICATDVEIGRGYMGFIGIPGHEFVGTVEETSRNELTGKRVVGEINCPCGSCSFCRRGLDRHCPHRTVLGISGRDGCFAEYLTLPDGNLHVLPDSLSDFQGVMVEPLAAAYRIVEQLRSLKGRRVAVVGDGKLGLLVAQAMASEGADVCLIGRHREREALISRRGVRFIEGKGLMLPELERAFDIAVDCTGSPDGPAQALGLLEPAGTLVVKSTVHERLRLPSDRLVVDEITVLGSRCGPFRRAIRALEMGEITVDGLLEESFSLEQAVPALHHASKPGALKVMLTLS